MDLGTIDIGDVSIPAISDDPISLYFIDYQLKKN